jgi:hypothetical protein
MKKSAILLVLLAWTTGAQAQKSFHPGYVVLPAGDTLRGEVDSRGAQRMAQQCLFRPAPTASATPYEPKQLRAYGLNTGPHFEPREIPGTPAAGLQPATAPALLFLQVLARGKTTLYKLMDEADKPHYYLQQGPAAVVELTQGELVPVVGHPTMMARIYPFRQLLSRAFADCAAVQPLLVNAELRESTLTNLFARYNTCVGADPTARVFRERKTKMSLGVLLGAQRSQMLFTDINEVLYGSVKPVVGLGLQLQPGSWNERVALRLEVLYQPESYRKMRETVGFFAFSRREYASTFKFDAVQVPLLLRYSFPGRVRPYLQAGGFTILALKPQAQTVYVETLPDGSTRSDVDEIEVSSPRFGYLGSLGLLLPLNKGSLQLEGRYAHRGSYSATSGRIGSAQTVSVLLGYSWGR